MNTSNRFVPFYFEMLKYETPKKYWKLAYISIFENTLNNTYKEAYFFDIISLDLIITGKSYCSMHQSWQNCKMTYKKWHKVIMTLIWWYKEIRMLIHCKIIKSSIVLLEKKIFKHISLILIWWTYLGDLLLVRGFPVLTIYNLGYIRMLHKLKHYTAWEDF